MDIPQGRERKARAISHKSLSPLPNLFLSGCMLVLATQPGSLRSFVLRLTIKSLARVKGTYGK